MMRLFKPWRRTMFKKIILSVVAGLFALCALLVFIGAAALFMPFAALAGIALMLLFFSLSIFDSVTGLLGLNKELKDVGIFDEAVQAYDEAIQASVAKNTKEFYAAADQEKSNADPSL